MIEIKYCELGGKKYAIYLKKIATKIDEKGNPIKFTKRAFVKEIDEIE